MSTVKSIVNFLEACGRWLYSKPVYLLPLTVWPLALIYVTLIILWVCLVVTKPIRKTVITKVSDCILLILERDGQVEGVRALAAAIPCSDPPWLREQLRRLQADGELVYLTTPGGRGRRAVIRKRNRNQPGQPRRIKK